MLWELLKTNVQNLLVRPSAPLCRKVKFFEVGDAALTWKHRLCDLGVVSGDEVVHTTWARLLCVVTELIISSQVVFRANEQLECIFFFASLLMLSRAMSDLLYPVVRYHFDNQLCSWLENFNIREFGEAPNFVVKQEMSFHEQIGAQSIKAPRFDCSPLEARHVASVASERL